MAIKPRKRPKPSWWRDITEQPRIPQVSPEVLIGSKAISEYVGVRFRLLLQWRREYGFPLGRLPNGRWCTTKRLFEEWLVMTGAVEMAASEPENRSVATLLR